MFLMSMLSMLSVLSVPLIYNHSNLYLCIDIFAIVITVHISILFGKVEVTYNTKIMYMHCCHRTHQCFSLALISHKVEISYLACRHSQNIA